MKGILLDTHTWIWFMSGDKTLKASARKVIDDHLKNSTTHIAAISCWEVAMLEAKNRITLSMPTTEWMEQSFKQSSINTVALTANIAYESCHLPNAFHGDPTDRLIVASARIHDLQLLTRDKQILSYAKHGTLRVLAC